MDLQLLSRCGRTFSCLSRSVPEIHFCCASMLTNQETYLGINPFTNCRRHCFLCVLFCLFCWLLFCFCWGFLLVLCLFCFVLFLFLFLLLFGWGFFVVFFLGGGEGGGCLSISGHCDQRTGILPFDVLRRTTSAKKIYLLNYCKEALIRLNNLLRHLASKSGGLSVL